MPNHRHYIQSKVLNLAKERYPSFYYQGRLSGHRYCFGSEVNRDPVPVYQHLVIRHHRRRGELLGEWVLSYFRGFEWKNLCPTATLSTDTVMMPLTKNSNWNDFFDNLETLRSEKLAVLTSKFLDRNELHGPMWRFYQGQDIADCSNLVQETVKRIVGQKDFSMSEPTEVRMSEFLGDYQSQGEEQGEGTFSIESNRARRKLADFQLADPRMYLVHLIAGAVAGGASRIELEVDADDVYVRFDGRALGREKLENLFSTLLSGAASDQERELAVGLNAASSLEPKRLVLKSRVEDKIWQWQLQDGEDSVLDASDDGEMSLSHSVHFRRSPSLQVVKRFFKALSSTHEHPEVKLVRERCAWSPVAISMGEETDLREPLSEKSLFTLIWEHHEQPVVAGFLEEERVLRKESSAECSILIFFGAGSGLDVCLNGVSYPSPKDLNLWGLRALVVDNEAQRDLSFSGLVEGERWTQIAEHLLAARKEMVNLLCERYQGLETQERMSWSVELQKLGLAGCQRVLELELFKKVGGGFVTRDRILNEKKILYSLQDFKHGLRSGENVYVLTEGSGEILGDRKLILAIDSLKSSQVYFKKLEEWLQKEALERVRLSEREGPTKKLRDFDGEMGLLPEPDQPAKVSFYAKGRHLLTREFKLWPSGVEVIVNHDRLEMDDHWIMLREDRMYELVRRRLKAQIEHFLDSLIGDTEHSRLALLYLLYLKKNHKSWKGHKQKLRFSTPNGGSLALGDIIDKKPVSQLSFREAMLKRPADLAKALTVPVEDLYLMRKLAD